jgi:hypothetical protein
MSMMGAIMKAYMIMVILSVDGGWNCIRRASFVLGSVAIAGYWAGPF